MTLGRSRQLPYPSRFLMYHRRPSTLSRGTASANWPSRVDPASAIGEIKWPNKTNTASSLRRRRRPLWSRLVFGVSANRALGFQTSVSGPSLSNFSPALGQKEATSTSDRVGCGCGTAATTITRGRPISYPSKALNSSSRLSKIWHRLRCRQ